MANLVDFKFKLVNLKQDFDLSEALKNIPSWQYKHIAERLNWEYECKNQDPAFIQKVVAAVKKAQFSHQSCCISLESIAKPSSGYYHDPFIQHLRIIAQMLYSYGIEVKHIDNEKPPQTITVTWHPDAHWLNPTTDFMINARKEEFRTDCILKFGEKCFKVHSTVLSAKSPVFKAMFQNQRKEAEHGAVIPIVMETFEEKSAKILVDYFYTGELKLEGTSVKQIGNLVNFSDQYHMPHLEQLCFEHLCKSVNADTKDEYIALAKHYQNEELETSIIEHMKQ
ncbi:MAG TPA: BTB/POZ domain-containing protein [Rhabdochlamydiaceae bacterium]|jgi:hypothetical protein|nr:BTB/POZ domain-containing protein [Rhabdochlamydiaceae bacterium]